MDPRLRALVAFVIDAAAVAVFVVDRPGEPPGGPGRVRGDLLAVRGRARRRLGRRAGLAPAVLDSPAPGCSSGSARCSSACCCARRAVRACRSSFVIVASIVLGALLLGWRALRGRARPLRDPRPRTRPGPIGFFLPAAASAARGQGRRSARLQPATHCSPGSRCSRSVPELSASAGQVIGSIATASMRPSSVS